EMPAGLLVTVPVPAPAWETVSREPVDTPVPVTSDERVSPSAVKLIMVLATAVVVGVKRTVTAWVAAAPTWVNGLPYAMLKWAESGSTKQVERKFRLGTARPTSRSRYDTTPGPSAGSHPCLCWERSTKRPGSRRLRQWAQPELRPGPDRDP